MDRNATFNRRGKMKKESLEDFIKRGGKVEKIRPGAASVLGSLDKSKKPQYDDDEIKKGRKGTAPRPDYSTYKKGSYHDYDVGGDKPPVWEKQPKNEMGGK